ncbi:MAG TPA: BatA and WFA domain-containing protein [Opitutaceae bacterium]|nr:BatA and WFA domain-containing protein [Opitutaceae bacterium]
MNLTFANPWMLLGLAAVGLPVLIHYLTRARPRLVVFPPFKFLVEACAGQQSLHRLRALLLLTLRCLALLALVLLFARPALRSRPAVSAPSQTRVAVIIDSSLSMRAVQNGLPLFARAKTEAAEILRSLDASAEAVVILAGAVPRPLLPALSRNITALHDALVKAEPTFESGDPAAALSLAKKLLGEGGTVYVFSDFQQANWSGVSELPAGLSTRVRSVVDGAVDNIGITSVRLAPAAPVIGEPVEVLCTAFNSSPRSRKETVRLALGDVAQSAQILIPPFHSANAAFRVNFSQPGVVTGQASVDADDLAEDNTRHIALRVHQAMQLLVLSDADIEDHLSAAFFISRALVPAASAAPGLTLVRRHSQDADRGILETADTFVIVAPATLSGEALEIIGRRVKDGAQLLAFLDGATSPSLLLPSLSPPFQLLRAVKTTAGEPLVPTARKLFAAVEAADWGQIRVHRRFQTQLQPGRGDDVLLTYADQSAALTLNTVGQGAVVFANMPLTPDGTDLIGHPLFPSLLHELLRLVRRGDDARETTPGHAWALDALTATDAEIGIRDPRGQPVAAQVLARGRTTRLSLPPAEQPGVFLAQQAAATVGASAVNIDPRESDTRPAALGQLKPGAGATLAVVRDEGELSLAASARSLGPECAAAAAFFFSAEMLLLAWWRPARARPWPAPTVEVRP